MPNARALPPQLPARARRNWRVMRSAVCAATALAALTACQPKADAAKTESAAVAPSAQPLAIGDPPVWTLDELGYGPIVVGMTYKAANDSLKGALKASTGSNLDECDYVTWEGGPAGLGIMVIDGKIARVDVRESTDIPTRSGARIGDSEERIKMLYGARVKVTDHKYEDGHYLTV
ncbi:MAG: hypothetical protein ABJB74_04790, partial [Gemmatimonas sp.]